MADTDIDKLRFRVVGTSEFADRVVASVFAKKLSQLVKAIEAADKSENGGKSFEYVITNLTAASPATATLAQQRIHKYAPRSTGFDAFGRCVHAVHRRNLAVARQYPECVSQLVKLAKDVEEKFDRSEIYIGDQDPVVVDKVFLSNAIDCSASSDEELVRKLYHGYAIGSFDGKILEVDLRGEIPHVMLILSAGAKEIKCFCPGLSADDIRTLLDRRVSVTGRAFYDGTSGLPMRIEVTQLPTIIDAGDFVKWKGAFSTIEPTDWSGDN